MVVTLDSAAHDIVNMHFELNLIFTYQLYVLKLIFIKLSTSFRYINIILFFLA